MVYFEPHGPSSGLRSVVALAAPRFVPQPTPSRTASPAARQLSDAPLDTSCVATHIADTAHQEGA